VGFKPRGILCNTPMAELGSGLLLGHAVMEGERVGVGWVMLAALCSVQ
jgi:hypothetical protein